MVRVKIQLYGQLLTRFLCKWEVTSPGVILIILASIYPLSRKNIQSKPLLVRNAKTPKETYLKAFK